MTTQSIQLVQTNGQQAFTTSLIVAEGCDNKSHESTIKLIRKHQAMFEKLAPLRFEIQKGSSLPQGGFAKSTEYAILNEDQATFLVTLFRNTPTVLEFKLNLVQQFRKALSFIAENFKDPPRTGLIHEKRASMWDMTDALKEIRAEAGKDTKSFHYATENKLLNWCVRGEFKPLDESSLRNEEVELLRKVRMKDAAYIRADMEYEERKAKLKAYADRLRVIKLIA
jgi:phage regulator Rha-like protein